MSFLYQHQIEICLAMLSLCAFAQSLFMLRGKGQMVMSVMLYAVGIGALGIGFVSPFFAPGHSASAGSAYAGLAGLVSCMAIATDRLGAERRQAKLAEKNPEPSEN